MTQRILRSVKTCLSAAPAPKPVRKVSAPYIPSTGALGVTIVSPAYADLAPEAVTRFQKSTGLEAVALHIETDSFTAKLHLDQMAPTRPIVFFDVDLWFLREAKDLGELAAGDRWCAVPDPCAGRLNNFVGKDVMANCWVPDSYFNSGLFACNLRRPEIRKVFEDARARLAAVQADNELAPIDTTDQFYLNWAVQQQPYLLKRLPLAMNFFRFAIVHGAIGHFPAEIVGLHAAGVPLAKKLETLRREASVFGPAL